MGDHDSYSDTCRPRPEKTPPALIADRSFASWSCRLADFHGSGIPERGAVACGLQILFRVYTKLSNSNS
jgi:hypothetical protein